MAETLTVQRVNSVVNCFAYTQNFPVLLGTEVQQLVRTHLTPHLVFQSSALTANWI